MVNERKIKGRLVECNITIEEAAKLMGIAQPTLSLKISNARGFYLDEVTKLASIMGLRIPDELDPYFFVEPFALCKSEDPE